MKSTVKKKIILNNSKFKDFDMIPIDGEDNKFKAFDEGLKEADEVNDLLNKAGDDPLNLITP